MSLRAEVAGPVDLLEIHRRDPAAFPFLLQSVAGHPQSGRYDVLFAFPGQRLTGERGFADFAAAIESEPRCETESLPFLGGWFLLAGYELAGLIEPTLALPPSPFRLAPFHAIRCMGAMIYDREQDAMTLISERGSDDMNYMKNAIHVIENNSIRPEECLISGIDEEDAAQFLEGARRITEYLQAGDVFQVNLSRAWHATLKSQFSYLDVYRGLRDSNPAPFAGLAVVDGVAVLSSSPERLVRIDGNVVQTRPIAGTRPRGKGFDDEQQRNQLIGNLKERAEHVMLIDLERNDLGRVCEPGSVEVSELMTMESYAHVHHIVSNVRGRLRTGIGAADVLKAVFPGGTITGCPKIRAMEIIAELERVGRGPYTGAMGYLSRCGRMDTNILIRSMVVQDGEVSFRAGAGIVADSQPLAELAETRAKARGLLLALGANV